MRSVRASMGGVARIAAVVRFGDEAKAEGTGASNEQVRSPLLFESAQTGTAPADGSSH